MLQRESGDRPLRTYGFLVAVEMQENYGNLGPIKVTEAMADALRYIEGIGKVEIDDLGSWDENEPLDDQWENEGGAVNEALYPKRRWND